MWPIVLLSGLLWVTVAGGQIDSPVLDCTPEGEARHGRCGFWPKVESSRMTRRANVVNLDT